MEFFIVLGLIFATLFVLAFLIPWWIVCSYDKKTGQKRQEEFERYMKRNSRGE